MSTYNLFIATLAIAALVFGGWTVAKHRLGFFSFIGIVLMISFLWLGAWAIPKFVKEDRARQRKEQRAKEEAEKVQQRSRDLHWASNSFKIKVGKEPSLERIQTALAEVREELRSKGIKGSERQWREFVEANIPVKWDGTQWVRDEAKWYQQWKN